MAKPRNKMSFLVGQVFSLELELGEVVTVHDLSADGNLIFDRYTRGDRQHRSPEVRADMLAYGRLTFGMAWHIFVRKAQCNTREFSPSFIAGYNLGAVPEMFIGTPASHVVHTFGVWTRDGKFHVPEIAREQQSQCGLVFSSLEDATHSIQVQLDAIDEAQLKKWGMS